MSARTSITQVSDCSARVPASILPAAHSYLEWEQLFRLRALQFVALAIAVFLWGFSYKISLYHSHPTPASRNSVAKLWLTQRPHLVIRAGTLGTRKGPHSHSHAFVLPARSAFQRQFLEVVDNSPYSNWSLSLDYPVSSRSPPPHAFV